MTIKNFLMKYRQTIYMSISAVLIILFFMPWFSNNPDLDTFAYKEGYYSGFSLFRGLQTILPVVLGLLQALGYMFLPNLLYLGYVIILLPMMGLAGIVFSGLRKNYAPILHLIHYITTFVLMLIFLVGMIVLKDAREMFLSIFRMGFGFSASFFVSFVGIVYHFVLKYYSKN